MMDHPAARRLIIPAVVSFFGILAGCSSHVKFVEGDKLRAEERELGRSLQFQIKTVPRIEKNKPSLSLALQQRHEVQTERRDVYQKVEVYKKLSWVHPDFFLWPVNAVRTPLGMAGCAVEGTFIAVHATLAEVVGSAMSVGFGVGLMPIDLLILPFDTDMAGDFLTWRFKAGWTAGEVIGDTPSVILETPQMIGGGPLYPFTRNAFANWGKANKRIFKGLWRFAWGYEAYSPFFIWPKKSSERRRDVPGETLPSRPRTGWQKQTVPTEWQDVPNQAFTISGSKSDGTVTAPGSTVTLDLLTLAEGIHYSETLRFTARVKTESGAKQEEFQYPVATLRDPLPPQITTVPPADGEAPETSIVFRASVHGDTPLVKLSVTHNGTDQPQAPPKGLDAEIRFKVLLNRGENTFVITAEDEKGLKTEVRRKITLK